MHGSRSLSLLLQTSLADSARSPFEIYLYRWTTGELFASRLGPASKFRVDDISPDTPHAVSPFTLLLSSSFTDLWCRTFRTGTKLLHTYYWYSQIGKWYCSHEFTSEPFDGAAAFTINVLRIKRYTKVVLLKQAFGIQVSYTYQCCIYQT